ncbi:MAG: hypothetical protein M1821_002278 [Bathelium mastoideum]|nr:MAG: hypothetical protein M1821_002278 [Bathelium mastoideum]
MAATAIGSPPNVPVLLRSPENKKNGSPKKPALEPNVLNVVLGKLLIKPWYPSFYPEDLVGRRTERLKKVCKTRNATPPGDLIYSKDAYSIHEVDGEEYKLYTQNLSLFAKLFLETKSVFYDVTTFLYYLLIHTDPDTREQQVVGFFSKEKLSWDNNNLACIIVFPPWQRRGLGQLLMGASYELSRREGRLGGPEKPLSEMGLKGYILYWSGAISRYLLTVSSKKSMTVRAVSEETYVQPEDIVMALKEMKVLDSGKKAAAGLVVNKAKVRQWLEANRANAVEPVDPGCFVERDEGGEEAGSQDSQ